MGFSISSTHLVFFLASMIVAATLAGVFIASTESITSGIRSREDALSERLKSDISIINDPSNVPNCDNLIIYVKNTGSTRMNPENIEVLVNGTLQVDLDIEIIDGNKEYWSPNEVIEIKVDLVLPEGDHWLKIVGPYETEDRLEFSI